MSFSYSSPSLFLWGILFQKTLFQFSNRFSPGEKISFLFLSSSPGGKKDLFPEENLLEENLPDRGKFLFEKEREKAEKMGQDCSSPLSNFVTETSYEVTKLPFYIEDWDFIPWCRHPDDVTMKVRKLVRKKLLRLDTLLSVQDNQNINQKKANLYAFYSHNSLFVRKIFHAEIYPNGKDYLHLYFQLHTGTKVRYVHFGEKHQVLTLHPFSLKVLKSELSSGQTDLVTGAKTGPISINDYEKSQIGKVITIANEIIKIIPELLALLLSLAVQKDKKEEKDKTEGIDIPQESKSKTDILDKFLPVLQNPASWTALAGNSHDLTASLSLLGKIIVNLNVLLLIFQRDLKFGEISSSSHLQTLLGQIEEAFNDESTILTG